MNKIERSEAACGEKKKQKKKQEKKEKKKRKEKGKTCRWKKMKGEGKIK